MDLVFISGPDGIGKSLVAKELNSLLKSVCIIEGSECQRKHFLFGQNKDNIYIKNSIKTINSALDSKVYETIIFVDQLENEDISNAIKSKIDLTDVFLSSFTLICSPETLQLRLESASSNNQKIIDDAQTALNKCMEHADVLIDTSCLEPSTIALMIQRNM